VLTLTAERSYTFVGVEENQNVRDRTGYNGTHSQRDGFEACMKLCVR